MAFSLLAHATGDGVGSDAVTGTIDTTASGGATLIVVGAAWAGASGTPTLTDSAGNTWTGLTTKTTASSDVSTRLFYKASPAKSATHSWTLSGNASYQLVRVAVFIGTPAASPFDVENGATNESASTLAAGSVTPTQDSAVIVTAGRNNSGTCLSIDSSFITTDLGSMGLAYIIQTTAGAVNPVWTYNASGPIAEVIAAFKYQTVEPDTQIWTTFRV